VSHSEYSTTGYGSRPAELYEFRYSDNPADIILFTSADHDITIGTDTYTSIAIERDSFSDDGNPDDGNTLKLSLPRINPLADLYRIQPPEKTVTVKIRAVQLDDPAQQRLSIWSGRVVAVSWEHPTSEVACERIATSLKRTGVRARYQRHCRHCHYGPGCGLDRATYEVPDVVSAVSNRTLLTLPAATGHADGYFNGGILAIGGVMRLIIQHTGDQVKINRPIVGLDAGTAVSLYPGCDRSAATCKDKFNNVENYGGFDFIPTDGPFDGNNINSIV
jgi:uncharacterized phage protein (TIGR02218 family)